MIELLNDMLELIYIADVDTYDLLFLNTAGREKFGVGKLDGLKCYKVLQGLDSPCSFCTNSKLTMDSVYSWEKTNPITNCHYFLKDRLVEWEGRKSRIEIAFDATESENEKQELKHALEAEKMIMECAKQLYQTDNLENSIELVLERVGTFLSAERAYIFDIRNNRMFNEYEWCATGIKPEIDSLQNLDISLIDGWMPEFSVGECKIIEEVKKIKNKEVNTYDVLARQGVGSLVAAPLEKNGKLMGYMGVDNPPSEKIKNIAPLFNTLRFFVMAEMRRAEDEKLLAKLSYYDTLTGFYNRNRFIQDTSAMSKYEGSIGLMYIDLNGLKDINDSLGHACGDFALCACARNISEEFSSGEFYRIGGDEFVVICKAITEDRFLEKVSALKNRFLKSQEFSAALGYQWSNNTDDIQAIISKADALMYKDKKQYYLNNPASKRYRNW